MTTSTRKPAIRSIVQYEEDKGQRNADRILVTSKGVRIGGSYWATTYNCWASWGIAGLSFNHATRKAAEAVQIEKWNSGPDHIAIVTNMLGKARKVLDSYENQPFEFWTPAQEAEAIARQRAWLNELEAREAMLRADKITRR